jgi:hypothetical protein
MMRVLIFAAAVAVATPALADMRLSERDYELFCAPIARNPAGTPPVIRPNRLRERNRGGCRAFLGPLTRQEREEGLKAIAEAHR